MLNRFRGCLLGLACGDALGTSVEFKKPGSFLPLTDMEGGGPFNLRAGDWTDDTSMALCLAASLIEKKGFDPLDQMQRYCRWQEEGYMSSTGRCFDIGFTTAAALQKFRESGDPFSGSNDPLHAGNGSLMRLAPIPMFYVLNLKLVAHYSAESSRTTHASLEAVDACRLFGVMLALALRGESKETILFEGHVELLQRRKLADSIDLIAKGSYKNKTSHQIIAKGYVVNTLEAALWSFWVTDTFREAVLCAANLGYDADTTASVCGQIAGAYYGAEKIPKGWLTRLAMADEIRQLADQLYEQRWQEEGNKIK
ncbi:MAG: ADP-ribosylglycohydrolase family protein [Anaerolineales bacterium]